ncbi:hypothetical protein BGZ51_009555 [Haplosporangium sp. Z 767]|nr:hypothetical protein BGZ51_009555 [Haplosporangium sp. Z 767]
MAAISISTHTAALKLDLISPSTLFFPAKTKATVTSTTKVTANNTAPVTTKVGNTATPVGTISLHPVTPPVATSTVSSSSNNGSSFSPGTASVNSSGSGNNKRAIVQQRHMTMAVPFRNTLWQRRHQYQHRSSYGHGHPFIHQIQTHIRNSNRSHHNLNLSPGHKKTHSTQLAGKLEDIMSSSLLQGPLNASPMDASEEFSQAHDAIALNAQTQSQMYGQDHAFDKGPESPDSCCSDYVYTAPCEHHPSKGQTDYLINDMFPKLEAKKFKAVAVWASITHGKRTHDLSTIEFGIRIADFMPLAFKTVPVAGLAEKELELLHDLGNLPNVIHLQDSFVNDNGDTVLVLPMLKKFECHTINRNLCSVRETLRQILTGLTAVHAKNIAHLDINPSNLMVTHDKKNVVIIDFGLSMTVDRCVANKDAAPTPIPVCGTSGYIAPEILNPTAYKTHDPTVADIYSLGVVLGEILEPYIPDCDLHYFGSKYLCVQNTNQTVAYLKDFIAQGSFYPKVLVQVADLLRIMLEEDPKERKSAQELLNSHPFLMMSTGANLELCDWQCRVQEIKYQKYLYQEKSGYEVYRYR